MQHNETIDDSFAYLPPEVIYDVIDQISGKRRFEYQHKKLAQLRGTWGLFFQGTGSEYFVGSSCRLAKESIDPSVGKFYFSPDEIPERAYFHNLRFPTTEDTENFRTICKIAHKFYGNKITAFLQVNPATEENTKMAMAKIQPSFRSFGVYLYGENVPQYYVHFFARMLRSPHLCSFSLNQYVYSGLNIEDQLLRFCQAEQFELIWISEKFPEFSFDFVSSVCAIFKEKNCAFDMKPRRVRVPISEKTAERLEEELAMKNVSRIKVGRNETITCWKQEPHHFMPAMTVEVFITERHSCPSIESVYQAIVALQKYNGKSLLDDAENTFKPIALDHVFMFEHFKYGVEAPDEQPFAMRDGLRN